MGSTGTRDKESRIQDIQECKQDNQNAKKQMTRLLNKLVAMLTSKDVNQEYVAEDRAWNNKKIPL